jgi:hypothetical protein
LPVDRFRETHSLRRHVRWPSFRQPPWYQYVRNAIGLNVVMMGERNLKWLLFALTIVLLIPSSIVIASKALSAANESAGWLRYKLPEVCFWTFLTSGLASPVLGIGTLLLLWFQRHRWGELIDSKLERRLRIALIPVSIAAVIAPAAWVFFFSEVFLVAGGDR